MNPTGDMAKKVKKHVFLSYTREDQPLARVINQWLIREFSDGCDVSDFLSDMTGGTEWMNTIRLSLKKADVVLLICSHASIDRWWMIIETGAGWGLDKPLVPLCHSGLMPDDLPEPLHQVNALSVEDGEFARRLFRSVADNISLTRPPKCKLTNLLRRVQEAVKEINNQPRTDVNWRIIEHTTSDLAKAVAKDLGRIDFIVCFNRGSMVFADCLLRACQEIRSMSGERTLVVLTLKRRTTAGKQFVDIIDQDTYAQMLTRLCSNEHVVVVVDDFVTTGLSLSTVVSFLREKVGLTSENLKVLALGRCIGADMTYTSPQLDYCGNLNYEDPFKFEVPYTKIGMSYRR